METHFATVNGWKVLIQRKPSAQTINLRAIVRAGSSHEHDSAKFGAAHFLEHMFFKGTKRRSYSEVNRKFAQLGNVNAYTTLERTVFYMNSLPSKLHEAASLLLELFFEPRMPEDEFEKERNVILEEYQTSEDNPIQWGVKKINWDTWGDALHPTIGTRESIQNLQIRDLLDFKNSLYCPERTLFVLTGNLDPQVVVSLLETLIPLHASETSTTADTDEPCIRFRKEHFKLDNPNSKQSLLFLIYPSVNDAETRALRFLPDLAVNLLGGGMHSVLFESVRERLGLCYAIGMQHLTTCNKGYHTVYTLLDSAGIAKAYEEVHHQFKLMTDIIDPDLFETGKANLLFDRSRASETASGCGSMADGYFDYDQSIIPFEEVKDGIESLTIGQVQDFIKQYLNDPKIAVVNGEIPV